VAAAIEAAAEITVLDGAVVVVTGAGMLGLTATAMATEAGAHVVVSDPVDERRETAFAFGAEAVADPRVAPDAAGGLAAAIARAGGRGVACTVGLDMSGSPAAVQTLLSTVDVGGVVVLVRSMSPGTDLPLDPAQLVRSLLTVRGVHDYAPRHLEQAARFLAATGSRYPFAEQVARILPLAQVDEALALAAAGIGPRVAVSPRM
jgi:threonine dehydrogenase-like Zn-dependent dehydrogenase